VFPSPIRWSRESSTRDAIRHYAHGISIDNPLWSDPAYAKNTVWGLVLAELLFSTSRTCQDIAAPLRYSPMWAGAEGRGTSHATR